MDIHERYNEYQLYMGYLKANPNDQKFLQRLRSIINQRQLVSCMNDTKWIKLLCAIEQLDFPPAFIVKRVTEAVDVESESLFCSQIPHYWGNWQPFYKEAMPIFIDIEYTFVQPRLAKYQGRLIDDLIIDLSEQFKAILIELNIPYVMEMQCFKICAYQTTQ